MRLLLMILLLTGCSWAAPLPLSVKGTGELPAFSAERGWGWESGDTFLRFTAAVPEGTYKVRVAVGGQTTVKAESRRLMVEAGAGTDPVTREFLVTVINPSIGDGRKVALRNGDSNPTWDDKLTLEFTGPKVAVQSIDIALAPAGFVTVYLAGDSTVVDNAGEPYTGWGQMMPRFFDDTVAVANYAESGRALTSFKGERRLDKILSRINSGDYLFIQFGHNDQKDKREGAGPWTTYKAGLEEYVEAVRKKGATPVLVTPMYRRRFEDGKLQNSLGEYPAAVRKVAEEQKVALIDLHEMSGRLLQALGEEPSKQIFVFYPAGAFGRAEEMKDNTHFRSYGAYEMARCVVEGIRTSDLPLARRLAKDVKPFDPSKPDAFESVHIPTSPSIATTKPAGN
jgi:lysophospholipase L1-like esterase